MRQPLHETGDVILTDEHSMSSYGIPVVLRDGEVVDQDQAWSLVTDWLQDRSWQRPADPVATAIERLAQSLGDTLEWAKPTDGIQYTLTTLERDGARALRGMLALIGEGESGTGGTSGYRADWTRGVKVKIYRNKKGGYAVSRHRWTAWQGESDKYEGWVADTPEDLLQSLYAEYDTLRDDAVLGSPDWPLLRPAEREAWDEACRHDPELASIECEEI